MQGKTNCDICSKECDDYDLILLSGGNDFRVCGDCHYNASVVDRWSVCDEYFTIEELI